MSNVQKEGDISNFSLVKTTHQGIKCSKCGMNPIIGYRYKCPLCKNYNLCQNCEEKNSETGEHPHDFIKMRNQEKQPQPPKKKEEMLIQKPPVKNIEYKYEFLDKSPEKYSQKVYIEEENEIIFEFDIKNITGIDFPQNGRTKFVITESKKEKEKILDVIVGNVVIDELKAGDIKKITITIPKKYAKLGQYKFNLILSVDEKYIGKPKILNLSVKSKRAEEFRNEFNLDEREFDDKKLLSALQKNGYNKGNAFTSLFNLD